MKERQKKKRRLPGAGGASILPTLQNTKTKPQVPLLPSLRSSLSSNRDSKTPPSLKNFPNFLHNRKKKKLAKNSKKQMWFPRHKHLDLLKIFGFRMMRNLSSHAGGRYETELGSVLFIIRKWGGRERGGGRDMKINIIGLSIPWRPSPKFKFAPNLFGLVQRLHS